MPGRLIVAPAGAGKTEFVLNSARETAQAWGKARIVVGSRRQAQAGYRGLAPKGAFGVRIHTLTGLARELLDMAGKPCILITDPIQIRLLRALVDQADLSYYAPLMRKPGFIRALRDRFAELTRARIDPGDFARQAQRMGGEPRLTELARLYAAYRAELTARGWTDSAGLIPCAVRALGEDETLARDWDFLAVDGFTRFHASDLALLRMLSQRVKAFIVTMTGDLKDGWEPSVAGPWQDAWEQAAQALGLPPESLPNPNPYPTPIASLTSRLLQPGYTAPAAPSSLDAIAAPDQAGEVRAALRWLKQRLVQDGLDLSEVALIARDLAPYRDAIAQTAAEFGLPVTLTGGLPLRENLAVDALMSLLNLFTPPPTRWHPLADPRFPYRDAVAAWRSPYFDWRWVVAGEDADDGGATLVIRPEDADALAALARWGRVTSGAGLWWDAFRRRAKVESDRKEERPWRDEDEAGVAAPRGDAARQLWRKWLCFRRSLTPPRGAHPVRTFVRWLEDLIGPEPSDDVELREEDAPAPRSSFTLNMIARIRASDDARLIARDIAALNAFKETLRGMVWAADALNLPPVTFQAFLTDLGGALEAGRYDPQRAPGRRTLLAGDAASLAGLRFRAVAILGLAEGVFPAILHEDAFLRGADREALRRAGWQVDPSPDNREAALFYLAFSRADARVLITRPRLAEGGADWPPSLLWRWLLRAAQVEAVQLTHENSLFHAPPASFPELMLALARHPQGMNAAFMREAAGEERLTRWRYAAHAAVSRYARRFNAFDGDLSSQTTALSRRYGPRHVWSPARLETYRACPYWFFAESVLSLEAREKPTLGMNAQQLGRFYHRALELVFRQGADKADDAKALIAIWEAMADDLLDEAPERYGFRPTAWWSQEREQIKTILRRTLERMAEEVNPGWRPRAFEAAFGVQGRAPLSLPHPQGTDVMLLRGVIDRVDHDGEGGMRIVDYKTGDVSRYDKRSLMEGRYLQLPLYAQAAAQVLEHGRAVDGFYWSVIKAKPSDLRLEKFGVEDAVQRATDYAWEAVEGVRAGRFRPQPLRDGCPEHCPAASFCWHYRPRGDFS